jgi:hypothetical protein
MRQPAMDALDREQSKHQGWLVCHRSRDSVHRKSMQCYHHTILTCLVFSEVKAAGVGYSIKLKVRLRLLPNSWRVTACLGVSAFFSLPSPQSTNTPSSQFLQLLHLSLSLPLPPQYDLPLQRCRSG